MISINRLTIDQLYTRRSLRLRLLGLIAAFLSESCLQTSVQGQESYYGASTTGIESTASWPWWHGLYYRADGSPKYGWGFGNMTRNHSNRLPVTPPICGPSYGYHQPCWKQIPIVRRCVTCETLQSNREIPSSNGLPVLSPTPVPPAPESSADQEAGASDLEPPMAAPTP